MALAEMPSRQSVDLSPDLQGMFYKTVAGDEESMEKFDHFLGNWFGVQYRSQNPNDLDDLIQEAKIKTFRYLDRFDYTKGRGKFFSKNLKAWLSVVGRSVEETYRKKNKRHINQIPLDSVESHVEAPSEMFNPHNDIDYFPKLKEEVNKLILNDSQRDVVMLTLEGKSPAEIGKELEIRSNYVRVLLQRGRKIIDQKLVYPSGYRHLIDFSKEQCPLEHLFVGARKGQLSAVRFLNVLYTTQENVDRYNRNYKYRKPETEIELI